MTAKPPTPQAIAALLRRSGFERSDFHHRDVNRHTASTGFRVWSTRSRSAPDVPVVAVAHFHAGQYGDRLTVAEAGQVWAHHVSGAKASLNLYAATLREAGYDVGRNFAADDPYLIVAATAEAAGQED